MPKFKPRIFEPTTNEPPPLWTHQVGGVSAIRESEGVLLDMCMGSGKTRTLIEAWNIDPPRLTVVLAPKAVIEQGTWVRDLAKFARHQFVLANLERGSRADKLTHAQEAVSFGFQCNLPVIIVTGHQSIESEQWVAFLKRQGPGLLVFDELHKFKSPKGRLAKFGARLRKSAVRRVGLTGTPMPHSPLDIFAQMKCLDADAYGDSWWRFRAQFAKMGGPQGKWVQGVNRDAMPDLQAKLAPYLYRVTRDDLAFSLPEVRDEVVKVKLGAEARRAYNALDVDFVAEVCGGEIQPANALVKLLRMQQLTSGTAVTGEDEEREEHLVDHAKQNAMQAIFEQLDPQLDPIVVFGRFTCDLDATERAARAAFPDHGNPYRELSGRKNNLAEWEKGYCPVLGVQIQAGGVGIDLTRARYCIYASTGFSLGDYEQSRARVHRPGQERPVVYYHLLAENTIDERVYHALRNRKEVVEDVLNQIAAMAL